MELTPDQKKVLTRITGFGEGGEIFSNGLTPDEIKDADSLVKIKILKRTKKGYALGPMAPKNKKERRGRKKQKITDGRILKVTKDMARNGAMIFETGQEWIVVKSHEDGRMTIRLGDTTKIIRQKTFASNFEEI